MRGFRGACALSLLALACTVPQLESTESYVGADGLQSRCEEGECIPCRRAQDCPSGLLCERGTCVTVPFCGDGIRNGKDECDDGNRDTDDGCVGCRLAYCGDGYLYTGREECEIGRGGPDAWTTITCSRRTCLRTVWNRCSSNSRTCPSASTCVQGVCAPLSELPDACPRVPGHSVRHVAGQCHLECDDDGACPAGLVCSGTDICVGTLKKDPPRIEEPQPEEAPPS